MFKTIAALCLVFCTTAATALATPADGLRITFTSYGPARIGMTRQTLESALGTKLKGDGADADSEACEYIAPSQGYEGIGFMLIEQRLARIDVSSAKVRTLSGAGLGSSQGSVLALYPGRVSVTPHFYTAPDGAYLTLLSSDKMHGIRFETDRGKVVRYYAGTAEAIQLVEGCQ
jgi:hypothetical protein